MESVSGRLAVVLLGAFVWLAGCGGGSGGGGVDLQLAPDFASSDKVSHGQERLDYGNGSIDISILPGVDSFYAWRFLDMNNDGDLDLIVSQGVAPFESGNSASNPLALPVLTFIGDGTGNFSASTSVISGIVPEAQHARKAVAMDFNDDGIDDVMIFDHGYDASPFPGAPLIYLQSQDDGLGNISYRYDASGDRSGFHHCGTAGDIDNDGDIDVFVGGFNPFFLVNDGDGNFEVVTNRASGLGRAIFTCELFDIDEDGYLDLMIGGHDWEGTPAAIFWGDSTGNWSGARRTLVPAVSNFGVVLDFDVQDFNGDGKNDIVINRTRGPESFYVGTRLQLLMQGGTRVYADETASRIDSFQGDGGGCGPGGSWIDWLVTRSVGGSWHIYPRRECGLYWENDGTGNFTLQGANSAGFALE